MKVLAFILLTFKLFALEMTLVHRENGVKSFSAGDFLKVTLEVSPRSDIKNHEDFFEFLSKKELGQFSILSHKDLQVNSTYSEIIAIDMEVVLRDEVKHQEDLSYPYKGLKIPIKIKGLNYLYVGFRPQVNILDLSLPPIKNFTLWIILLVIFLLAIVGVILRRRYKRNKSYESKYYQEIEQLFRNLDSREKLELIYRKRKIWEFYVRSDLRGNFYSTLNGYQYKKIWSPEELDEVCQAAKKLELKFP